MQEVGRRTYEDPLREARLVLLPLKNLGTQRILQEEALLDTRVGIYLSIKKISWEPVEELL